MHAVAASRAPAVRVGQHGGRRIGGINFKCADPIVAQIRGLARSRIDRQEITTSRVVIVKGWLIVQVVRKGEQLRINRRGWMHVRSKRDVTDIPVHRRKRCLFRTGEWINREQPRRVGRAFGFLHKQGDVTQSPRHDGFFAS